MLYRALLDASPDPIVVYDIEGCPTYLNPAFARVFGWTFDELKGRKIDFVPPENRPETREMIDLVLDGVVFSGRETKRRTKDGRIIDVSISGSIFFDEQGKASGSVVVAKPYGIEELTDEVSRVLQMDSDNTSVPADMEPDH